MPPYEEFVGVGRLVYEIIPAFETVLARHRHALILVDVPIGLRASGQDERLCDREARQLLRGRGSSVFPAPVRAALTAADYAAASSVNRENTEGRRALSRQSWAITPKIREVNECLAERETPPLPRVREVHTELCFWALNRSEPLQHNKRTQEGYGERIALLSRHLPEAVSFVERILREHLRKVVRRDDVVDALVGLVTARLRRGDLRTVPETPEVDSAACIGVFRVARIEAGVRWLHRIVHHWLFSVSAGRMSISAWSAPGRLRAVTSIGRPFVASALPWAQAMNSRRSPSRRTSRRAFSPSIRRRAEQPYVGAQARVAQRELAGVVPRLLSDVHRWLRAHDIVAAGVAFVRYLVVDYNSTMLEIEAGVPSASPATSVDEGVRGGVIPAGSYATVIHHGLAATTAKLLAWAMSGQDWVPKRTLTRSSV